MTGSYFNLSEPISFKGDKDDLANSEKLKGHALKVRQRPHARVNSTAIEQHILIIRFQASRISHHHHSLRRQVMTTVGVAVAGLKDLGALVPVLEGLGAKHKGYGVLPAHYDVVGQALARLAR